jgi:hypothetical protein
MKLVGCSQHSFHEVILRTSRLQVSRMYRVAPTRMAQRGLE